MTSSIPVEERSLIEKLSAYLKEIFSDDFIAFYALGSLAHGGYSKHCSDIDLLIILNDPINDEQLTKINLLHKINKDRKLPLLDKISLFYGSIQSINLGANNIRLPAYDKQDLIENGILLYGEDIRQKISPPSKKDILLEGIKAYFDYFTSSEVKNDILNISKLALNGETKKISKLILIPVRFLHSLYEPSFASCENAVESFVNRENNIDAIALVNFALDLRADITLLSHFEMLNNSSKVLIKIYVKFFEQYKNKLSSLGEDALSHFCAQSIKVFTESSGSVAKNL